MRKCKILCSVDAQDRSCIAFGVIVFKSVLLGHLCLLQPVLYCDFQCFAVDMVTSTSTMALLENTTVIQANQFPIKSIKLFSSGTSTDRIGGGITEE